MLREARNKVDIVGILSEVDLDYGSINKNGSPMTTIKGTIKVRVNQTLPSGEKQELEIPVNMFATEFTNKGTKHPGFESIERVKNEFKSIAAVGIENADYVRISNGRLEMNEYYGQNGNLISYPRITTNFVDKVSPDRFPARAEFVCEFQVGSMGYKTDADGVEDTSCYQVVGIVPKYGGKVWVMPFLATYPNVIAGVQDTFSVGDSVVVTGRLNFTTQTSERVIEQAFGEPQVKVFTTSVSDLVIKGGDPLGDELAFDNAEIAEALKTRQADLAALKDRQKNRTKEAPIKPVSYTDLGF